MNNELKLTIPIIVMLLVSLLSFKVGAIEYIEGDCIVIPVPIDKPVTVRTLK